MGKTPAGFHYRVRSNGDVVILPHGKLATTLRGAIAAEFLTEATKADPQHVMTRLTGDYRRGNERAAKQHPRNSSSSGRPRA